MEKAVPAEKVFLSYSRADLAFVDRLVQALEERGIDVWRDTDDIPGGAAWTRKIEAALEATHRTVVVLSPSSVESDYVQDEIVRARELKHLLIPLLYQDCKIPLILAGRQHIDFREGNDFDTELERLVQALTGEPGQPSVGEARARRLASRRRTWARYALAGLGSVVLVVVLAWTLLHQKEMTFDRLLTLKKYAGAESLQPQAHWVRAADPNPRLLVQAFVAGYEQDRQLPLCRAIYEGRTYAGKIVADYCNIPVGDDEIQRDEFDYLVPKRPNLTWRRVTKEDVPTGIVPFTAGKPQSDRVLVCRAAYRGGEHPGTLIREGCMIPHGRATRLETTFDLLVLEEH